MPDGPVPTIVTSTSNLQSDVAEPDLNILNVRATLARKGSAGAYLFVSLCIRLAHSSLNIAATMTNGTIWLFLHTIIGGLNSDLAACISIIRCSLRGQIVLG